MDALSPEEAVKVMIILIVYILPFAILPFIVGSVSTVGGALTGRLNNRAKGIFDRSRKGRQEIMGTGVKGLLAGQRGKNGGILQKTGLALGTYKNQEVGTRRGLFGAGARGAEQRRAARTDYMTQLKNNEAQSARARSLKDNDDVNRALVAAVGTDGSRQAVREAMMAMFPKMDPDKIENAIEGAIATGGFSDIRGRVAHSALTASGTGWETVDQVVEGAEKIARGNNSLAASILGEHNAVTKGVGRHDLAPGFGNIMQAWQDSQSDKANGDLSRTTLRQNAMNQARQQAIDSGADQAGIDAAVQAAAAKYSFLDTNTSKKLYTDAAKDVDPYSMLRQKKAAIENMSAGVNATLRSAQDTMMDGNATPEERQEAAAEAGRLTGAVEKLESVFASGSVTSVEAAGSGVVTPTVKIRQEIMAEVKKSAENPPEIEIRDPGTGVLVVTRNPTNDPVADKARETAERHAPPFMGRRQMTPEEIIRMNEELNNKSGAGPAP